jgi:FMN reductase
MLIVGIGGTVSPTSSSDTALRLCMDEVAKLGADVRTFTGSYLKTLPMYDPTVAPESSHAHEFVAALRAASGVVLSSAAYHGSVSGMLKNALDYTEDLASDERVYFSGVPVGTIAVAKGWQAGAHTLTTLRAIVHALRGWPTPYGCVINTAAGAQPPAGIDAALPGLLTVAQEVVFAARAFQVSALLAATS